MWRQNRSRLVHDKEARILKEAADNLDALALADGECVNRPIGCDIEPVTRGDIGNSARQLAERALVVYPERDVLGDRQGVKKRKMLEYHTDAEPTRDGR